MEPVTLSQRKGETISMAKKHVYYSYVDDMEAKYGDGRSNRTLIAELSGKEQASERQLYKAVAGVVSSLYDQWDREKHAAFGKDEHKTVDFEPELLVYPDRSKKFSCTMSITHLDFSLLALDLPRDLRLQIKQHPFTAFALEAFTGTFASAYNLALPYVKAGYQPEMNSVRTVTPDIHFPGFCPSPIPQYVQSLKKFYREPPLIILKRDYVQERLVETKPWFPVPDEPEYMLISYGLNDNSTLYDIKSIFYSFRPIAGLKLEKKLMEGYAVLKDSMYELAWLGITPFARELTKWHTYEKYYQNKEPTK
jgi:hypothetical protein